MTRSATASLVTILVLNLPSLLVAAQSEAQAGAPQAVAIGSADGRRQIAAVEATSPITVDGALDEEVWGRAQPAGAFVQAEPREGQPASESTEVRVAFDREFLYIGATCRDSQDAGPIVNEIRKDFTGLTQDTFEVLLDTFADRRNGFVFVTNPAGAKADAQFANEGRDVNPNWDAVWWVAVNVEGDGWTAELKIPFKTLRFEPGSGRTWGINFARRIRRRNEIVYWAPVPRAYSIYRASLGGDLTGLPDLAQGLNLRVKPFVLGGALRNIGGRSFDGDHGVGVDVKYGVTSALTLDLTAKPDFAQAEADEQQVNLTQFSLFFPEKREFFLENSGIFYFGDIPRNQRTFSRFRPPEEELLLFFSRRIGLTDSGEQTPLHGGARLTGRVAGLEVGAMTLQTGQSGNEAGNNYTVLRARGDLLKNSDIGAIVLSRQSWRDGNDYNRVAGVDANFRFLRYLSLNSFVGRSFSPNVTTGQGTAKGSIGWEDNLTHFQYSLLSIGDNFRDDMGFVRRVGVRKNFFDAGVRPRPAWLRRHGWREMHPHLRLNDFTDQQGNKVSVQNHFGYTFMRENSTQIEFVVEPRFERIDSPFRLRSDKPAIPAGSYEWNQYQVVIETDHSRRLSGSARLTGGGFWSGTQKTAQLSTVYRPSYRLFFDMGLQVSAITLNVPRTEFVTTLINARAGYSFSTRMFLDSLVQYRTDQRQLSANVRLNLIHRPLSDFFVVYNEQQLTDGSVTAGRGIVLKYTQMLSF